MEVDALYFDDPNWILVGSRRVISAQAERFRRSLEYEGYELCLESTPFDGYVRVLQDFGVFGKLPHVMRTAIPDTEIMLEQEIVRVARNGA